MLVQIARGTLMESHPYKKRWGVGGTFLLIPNPKRPPGVAAAHKRRHPRLFIYFQAEYTGFATMKSGFAPAFGRNFCTRPASTSAT